MGFLITRQRRTFLERMVGFFSFPPSLSQFIHPFYCRPGPNVEHRTDEREGVVSARTYDYSGEAECDANMRIMLQCIDMAAATSDTPFAAIKVSYNATD